jgi:hypothetical protein
MSERDLRRLPFRQLLAHSDKKANEVVELVYKQFVARISDYRDMTRPVRRKSSYPTMLALLNSLRRLRETHDELNSLLSVLHEHLDAIRDHAQREKLNRKG